ncbi:FecCD family ABC transporter permease [Streptomyces cylindrosporus]|uniref:Iron ABC transporter permease n=1 Tax=Streptomyces cylindrosporus TaxID=2927583 RepID=A0ABS9YDT1_9ACTN|nr:iron ABC transporter permease [Streptomyces cylindrosporus]MCI3275389.1 iron ABC transporter permease [Streptomyces cylindrosporus]
MATKVPAAALDRADQPPARRRTSTRTLAVLGALLLLLTAIALSLAIGSRSLSLSTVVHALFDDDGSTASSVIWDVRVPRTLAGIAAGAALGVAGALIQALTRNPLADPGLLGINAGAAAGVVLSITALGLTSMWASVWFAMAGAVVAGLLVYSLASGGRGGATPERLALGGAVIAAVFTGIGQTLMLLDAQALDQLRFWSVGSLARADSETLTTITPFVAVGLLLALSLVRPLNALALGDDTARALGAHLDRTRFLGLLAVTLLCGAATAAVGPLVFVGLAVPHMARMIAGADQRWTLPLSMLLAPALLLYADVLGRVVVRPDELDAGVVTAVIGAPVFIALVRHRRVVAG